MANFSEINVPNIEGNIEVVNLSKIIGNALYTQGRDVAICECGKRIYYGEDVELTAECKDFIRQVVAGYPYILRTAIEEVLG